MGDAEKQGIAGLPAATIEVAPVGSRPDTPHRPPSEWPLALLLAAVAIAGAWALISSEWGKGGPQKAAAAVADHGSMLDNGRFAGALERIAGEAGGAAHVSVMRVDAAQVWTVLQLPGGSDQVLRVGVDGELTAHSTAGVSTEGLRLNRIDPQAPSRMLAALRRRDGVEPARVDYLTLSAASGSPASWSLFLLAEEGTIARRYVADAHGRDLERAG